VTKNVKVGNRKCVVIEVLVIKNLANKFLWRLKDNLVVTTFMTIEMGPILIVYKPALGNP